MNIFPYASQKPVSVIKIILISLLLETYLWIARNITRNYEKKFSKLYEKVSRNYDRKTISRNILRQSWSRNLVSWDFEKLSCNYELRPRFIQTDGGGKFSFSAWALTTRSENLI